MRARLILSSLLLASLAGCGGGSDFADLQSYMDEVRARPKGTIEPLPKFQPYEAFTYSAASLRSPFQPPVKIDLTVRQKGNKVIKPDETRVKQFLEGFNIETFEMVGTLSNAQGTFALVKGAVACTGEGRGLPGAQRRQGRRHQRRKNRRDRNRS